LVHKPRDTHAHPRAPSARLLRRAARLRIARKSGRELIQAAMKITLGTVHAQIAHLRRRTRSPVRPTLNLKRKKVDLEHEDQASARRTLTESRLLPPECNARERYLQNSRISPRQMPAEQIDTHPVRGYRIALHPHPSLNSPRTPGQSCADLEPSRAHTADSAKF
jgi:hypothetical protein